MNDLQKEFSNIFESVNDGIQRYRTGYPRFSIDENDQNVIVKVFLPGYKSADIDVQVVSDFLTIAAKREPMQLEDGEKLIHNERMAGAFEETFNLPAKVDCEKVEAKYRNGILHITLPKHQDETVKAIKIV